MLKTKWLKVGLTTIFIVFAGILFSCKGNNEQAIQVDLQNQENSSTQEEIQELQEDIEKTEDMQNVTDDVWNTDDTANAEDKVKVAPNSTKYIYIHICGAVYEPNVYEVVENSRLIDIIKLAGGLTENAAGDYVNQAAIVEDGQQIYIPTMEEKAGMTPSSSTISESQITDSGKVNINTATIDELMTLTGIGESKAKSIIAYREDNDGFQTIDEIKNISGIKDSVFNKICDFIIVK